MQHVLSTRLLPAALMAVSLPLIAGVFSPASAASLSFSVSPFTGSNAKVNFTLDDTAAGAGNIQFKVDVDQSVSLADLRGVFFNIQDDSLLSGLSISGANVTQSAFDPGKVINLGGGNNLNGGSTSGFDIGLEIGEAGLKGGADDIRSTVFTLSHSSRALSLSQFINQSFGARVTSVGAAGTNRSGSSKLSATAPTVISTSPTPPAPTPAPPAPTPAPPAPTPAPPAPTPAPPNLPPVVVVPPAPPAPAKVPEPGMTGAIVLSAIGAVKLLKRKSAESNISEQGAEA